MTARELIEQLRKEDPDSIVVMASDSEGNSYSPLYTMSTCVYEADTTWSGAVYYEDDEVVPEKVVPAIALHPTN